MRCDQLQPSWKPSFLCCSECSCKIGEYAPDLISCSRVRSEHVLGCSFLCSVTRNVQSKTAHVSSVSTITTRNNSDIESIFGANIHHVPGLCLLGIGHFGGSPYISHKIMAQKPYFHIFDFSLKP